MTSVSPLVADFDFREEPGPELGMGSIENFNGRSGGDRTAQGFVISGCALGHSAETANAMNGNGVGMRKGHILFFFLLFTGLIGPGEKSFAGSVSAPLTVKATVVRSCSLATTPLTFGTYDPVGSNASADLRASTNVTVVCSPGATPTISVGSGIITPGMGTTRAMSSGSDKLSYQIYKDSGLTQVWTDSGSGVLSLGTVQSALPQTVPVYGRIPAGQNVSVGSYSDTVTVTINF
jgi:spore coat protein U-like protein